MPGLFFYFPCNEGGGDLIKSFPGVSGQQATLPGDVMQLWGWYDSGFFNRPALRVLTEPEPLELFGADPSDKRSFQFLWYCSDPSQNRTIFGYSLSMTGFALKVTQGVLEGRLFDQVSESGTTQLQAEKWYLIQINTEMMGGWNPDPVNAYQYWLTMKVYLGGTLELTAQTETPLSPGVMVPLVNNVVSLAGMEGDGFDELRHLKRHLYESEMGDYAAFLKQGRVAGKSKGSLGSVGW